MLRHRRGSGKIEFISLRMIEAVWRRRNT
uniref:Uncharacterized protein n=1 Tax=Arundo donax TaxID=35708 RepID=A0A0A9BWI7_ARUDO